MKVFHQFTELLRGLFSSPRVRCPYISSVVETDECPNLCEITFMFTFASINSEACVCLNQWGVEEKIEDLVSFVGYY